MRTLVCSRASGRLSLKRLSFSTKLQGKKESINRNRTYTFWYTLANTCISDHVSDNKLTMPLFSKLMSYNKKSRTRKFNVTIYSMVHGHSALLQLKVREFKISPQPLSSRCIHKRVSPPPPPPAIIEHDRQPSWNLRI